MKIVISGGWSYGNIGDEAIAASTIYMIKKYFPEDELIVMSYDPNDFEFHHSVKSNVSLHRIMEDENIMDEFYKNIYDDMSCERIQKYAECFDENTLFIMAGGGYFMSQWSLQFKARLLEIYIAKQRKAKIALIGQSIGPVNGTDNMSLFRECIELVDYINVRDQKTYDLIRGIAKSKNIKLGADTAIIISEVYPKENDSKKIINVTPMGFANYMFIDGIKRKNSKKNKIMDRITFRYYKYFYSFRFLIKAIIKKHYYCQVILSTNWIKYLQFSKKLFSFISNKHYRVYNNFPIEEMCKLISKGDYTISAKLHPVIIATSYGIPSIAISYNFKVDEFMSSIGRASYCFRNYELDFRKMLNKFDSSVKGLTSEEKELIKKMKMSVEEMFSDLTKL